MLASSHEIPVFAVPGADPQLCIVDLAPVAPAGRTWGTFSLFAMWMSDVHSVGGCTFAASLFFFGLALLGAFGLVFKVGDCWLVDRRVGIGIGMVYVGC